MNQHRNQDSHGQHLKVGFLLAPSFTLLALTGFIEPLRQAADVGDRSRQVWCSWSIMNHELTPIRSSCGLQVIPWEHFRDPRDFDYIILVGGLLDKLDEIPPQLTDYIKKALRLKVPIIALCTGSFILAQEGLMNQKRCCVHWYHYQDFRRRYPETLPVIDELFVEDQGIITSPGGLATTDLALFILEQNFGAEKIRKVLRHMILDWNRPMDHPQTPYLKDYADIIDPRVRRAVFYMEQNMTFVLSTEQVAEEAGVSARQLERLFQIFLRESPASYFRKLRLRHANWMLRNTRRSITEIAMECGFSDNSHFAKRFKNFFGISPGRARRAATDE